MEVDRDLVEQSRHEPGVRRYTVILSSHLYSSGALICSSMTLLGLLWKFARMLWRFRRYLRR